VILTILSSYVIYNNNVIISNFKRNMKKRLKVQALPKSIKNAEAYIGKEYKILKETDTTWVLEEDN